MCIKKKKRRNHVSYCRRFRDACHYEPSLDETLSEIIRSNNLSKVIALPENAGIEVTNQSMNPIGTEKPTIFENARGIVSKREFSPLQFSRINRPV
jgi:hypothetical protein